MAIGFQTGGYQSNGFQQAAAGPAPVAVTELSKIYLRDNWRTVYQSLKFPIILLITFWT